jgi:hypothetical protein
MEHDKQRTPPAGDARGPGGSQGDAGKKRVGGKESGPKTGQDTGKKSYEFDRTDIHRTDTREAEMGGQGKDDKGRTQGLPKKTDADNYGGQGRMGPTQAVTRSGAPDQPQTEDADAKRVAESNAKQSTPDRSVGPRGIDGAVSEGVDGAAEIKPDSPDRANKAW